jgi:hypothetical protein
MVCSRNNPRHMDRDVCKVFTGKMIKVEKIEYLPSKNCRRRKCYCPVTDRVHEYDAQGHTSTGALGTTQNYGCSLIVFRREFKRCYNSGYKTCRENK